MYDSQNEKIDLVSIYKSLVNSKRIVYLFTGLSFILGILIILLSKPIFTAKATILPIEQSQLGNLGGLGSLAGMAGINLNSLMGESSVMPVEIYPKIVYSFPFLNDLMLRKYSYEGFATPITAYEYYDTKNKSMGQKFIENLFPLTLVGDFFPKTPDSPPVLSPQLIAVSEDKMDAIRKLQNMILLDIDIKTDIVTITINANHPTTAAQYVQTTIELLQSYIIEYKTKQSREYLAFVQNRYNEKKLEFEHAQMQLFNYRDRHRNVLTDRMGFEYQSLEDEYNILATVYKGLAQQLEQSKIAVKHETPAFSVIQPPIVPNKKSSPRVFIIIFVSLFLGFSSGFLFVLYKNFWESFKNRLFEPQESDLV